MTMWSSSSEAAWAALWARYDKKSDLATLDAWYLATFPPILRVREPEPYVTQQELQHLMEWKLKKGKRPQLMKFVSGLSESEVKQASLNAFKELSVASACCYGGTLRSERGSLQPLYCVGPATASAVLAAYDENVPFMADEALEAIAGIIGPRKYTLPHFLSFAEQLRAKAKWLNEQRAANDDEKAGDSESWTAQRVQLCLYVEAHDGAATGSVSSKKKAPSPAAKRKRDKPTTPTPAKKKEEKPQEESAKDQDQSLRRSQRKRQRPAA
ncbi:hypothetical protein GQ600_3344 [Phytophthora cactorum]|nr:hypothetical protein GQ600_3344 [Phytophthora cactorum]